MEKQGAEAIVSETRLFAPELVCIRKHRPPKPYRHPRLDQRLTKGRAVQEARLLHRCHRAGLPVPRLLYIDEEGGDIYMERIPGCSLRDALRTETVERGPLMEGIGALLGRLHGLDIVHGDLTTSNLMLTPDARLFLIDFGLGSVSAAAEDKAVDLYVLERAFAATHPLAQGLFDQVLQAYASAPGSKAVLRRLQDVRLRGRKRSMVG